MSEASKLKTKILNTAKVLNTHFQKAADLGITFEGEFMLNTFNGHTSVKLIITDFKQTL
jgi:hypothetical protein